jgi:hypothetical protein
MADNSNQQDLNAPTSNRAPDSDVAKLRAKWGRRVKSVYTFTKKEFDGEAKVYLKMLRNEFSGILPARLLLSDRIDVNVIYPIVKSLVPNLYFQDPKVFVKAEQEKITHAVTAMSVDETTGEQSEEPVIDPATGDPIMNEYDGAHSALIFQNALNQNLDKARTKTHVKNAIIDAHLTYYGVVKCGWGNDQGVASMGADGAPPSIREDVDDNMAYAIRLRPWNVIADMTDFYNPAWVAVRYTVDPEQLKQDKRLSNTDQITGQSQIDDDDKQKFWRFMDKEDLKKTEYWEIYVKPCAEYPKGKFFMLTEEVKDAFLYEDEWPLDAKEFPIKFMYFNTDPEGGLPIPDARYYANHQKAKLNLRNAEYEFVQRSMPILGIDISGVKDSATAQKQMESGQMPRIVQTTRNPQRVIGGVSFPSLGIDFRNLDSNLDVDVSRIVGLTNIVTPTANAQDQLATSLKIADKGEQVRQNERADIVSDFLKSIVVYWAKLYQEFAGPENYTTIDGEKFPVKWTKAEINGKFIFSIKPFSMSYEDPIIRRRQWVDLLNLLAAPETQQALAVQGAQVDILKIVKRILETYDERDVESFVIDEMAKPENQVARAVQENSLLAQGDPNMEVKVLPTDNHKLHILVHSMLGDVGLHHIEAHNEAMMEAAGMGGTPGGGNAEGLPTNGVAVNQGQLKEPLEPSAMNKKIAIKREATR